ncbi:RluA family pseudouridine synthase [Gaiella sp.]|uniref:RluA family pseudouridine synthase n=1 Tax=Gaiella sp. TaxID=2663207 RepID=UPI003265805E
MARLRFHVLELQAGARLDRVVAARPQVESRAFAERLIAGGLVLVDGEVRGKSFRLEGGEEITVQIPAVEPLRGESLDIEIVWEDEHLLVVDKPAGLVVHPAGSTRTGTLVQGLIEHGAEGGDDDDRPGIVHRLDRDTSGLLIVARSSEAFDLLQEMIRKREVERTYAALVRGAPASMSGRIEAPIGRDRRNRSRHSLDTPTPREAVTWFEVRETLRAHTLLDVRLETGRTHQIRVHLEAIDLPVSGDPVYGIAGDLGLERQFLHARRLVFEHPSTGEAIDIASELPADLASALDIARR